MSKQLLILGCSQTKRQTPGLLPAIERYNGSYYRVLRRYLRERQWPDSLSVAILSARYGLIGGFTDIEDYNERMNQQKALEWAPKCQDILNAWSNEHSQIHFSLGKDYLPAVEPAISSGLQSETEIFEGPIGMKLHQIKNLLENSGAPERHKPILPEPGSGEVSYFLPDWDDLLDEDFDFESDSFSDLSRQQRNDKHCCVLMQPKRMCDGILVSLAQHVTSKGPLRRNMGTDSTSLAPKNLRIQFGLGDDQSLFGDCGAFSYVNEDEPAISVEQAIALYDLYGFDFGASVDHIPVPVIERNGDKIKLSEKERIARVERTKQNAELFIELAKQRQVSFIPVGTIQALNADEYAQTAYDYHLMGYRHLAIGGLVPMPDSVVEETVRKVMMVVSSLEPRPWVHLFGIFRPKLQAFFRELKIDSFDSASYFRKAWLRSDQNYLASNGEWYAALRVPMTSDGRTRKRLEQSGLDIKQLEVQESQVMRMLCQFDRDEIGIQEVLDAVIEYDKLLTRSSDVGSLRLKYQKTLTDRPWKNCDCPFCQKAGIHMLIFRGSNRNKRRGAHNTLMLYGSLEGAYHD
ncbi:MAG: Queuine tRNA-ribosyltransferase [Pelotomaculum sp. PtaU1.Bin035]|nr:MAG: Queuine tRNA-ribosyltransferase [Pelotomaculum sp. PtaU1.Bin035]